MEQNKDALYEKLNILDKERKEIRELLSAFDYEERLSEANQYLGKYFKKPNAHHKEHISCLFIYAIDKQNCTPKGLGVNYWNDNNDTWFEIDYVSHFRSTTDEDYRIEWVEITKEEFMLHFQAVQNRISAALTVKI